MTFYFQDRNGNTRELAPEEVAQHLSECQIEDAIQAKKEEPLEEVSYMTAGGFVILEL